MSETELPDGWIRACLTDICHVEMGQSPPSITYNTDGDGLPFFQGKAEFRELYPETLKWCNKPNKIANANDILISVRAPVGPSNLAPEECCIGRGLAALSPETDVDFKYILHSIRNQERNIATLGTGTTFSAITGKVLREFKLPIAPTNEQKRIVAKIEELFSHIDAGVAALERAKENLKRYRGSVLKSAVEGKLTEEWRKENPPDEPADKLLERILIERRKKWMEEQLKKYEAKGKKPPENWKSKYKEPASPDTSNLPELPEGWCWASIEQLVTNFQNGFGKRQQKVGLPTIVLRLADITAGRISLDSSRNINALKTEVDTYRLSKNDLLVLRVNGSPDLVGRIVLFENPSENEILFCDHFIRLRCYRSLVSKWLRIYGDTQTMRRFIDLNKVSSAGQNTISQTALAKLVLPFPPEEEILYILEKVEGAHSFNDVNLDIISKCLAKIYSLRQTILKQAFEGKLVPQGPNDEPASALLEKIKAERKANEEKNRKKKTTKTRSKRPRK